MDINEYIRKAEDFHGLRNVVPVNNPLMKYVNMDLLRLDNGENFVIGSKERELGLVIISGNCNVSWKGGKTVELKSRTEPLGNWPHAIYIPPTKSINIEAKGKFEAAIYETPADYKGQDVCIVNPEDCEILDIGKGNCALQGTFVIYDKVPSQNLVVGETHIPAGHWTVPPHSHEKDVPGKETKLEEIYYFRFRPSKGFGFQGLYTLDHSLEKAYILHDGDVILVPKGNHPNVPSPGYEMFMSWGMAGPHGKKWIPFEDPDHTWIGSIYEAINR